MLITLGSPPTAAETDAWHAVVSAAHVRDLPAAVPEPSRAETAGKLSLPPVGGRNVHLASTAADGSYDGVASMLMFADEDKRHTAFLDQLVVRPDARRHGIGAKLWSEIRAELAADGRTSATTVLELGGAGEAFVDSLGFSNVQPLGWYVQKVGQALDEIPQPPLPEGLRFVDWTGRVPEEWAESFVRARGTECEAIGEASITHQLDRDVARAGAAARLIEQRGGVVLTSAVIAPADDAGDGRGGGAVAAYTEVILKAPTDARALQHATVVVPQHRGQGLGRAVKRHLLDGLRELHPAVREISTTVADDNASMLAVNESLGYRRERPAGLFEAKL